MKKYYKEIKGTQWFAGLAIFLFILVVLVVGWTFLNRSKTEKSNVTESKSNIVDNSPKKVIENVKSGKTYDEAKKESPNLVKSPNLSTKEVKEEIRKLNPKPSKHNVSFDGKTFSPTLVTIKQGDYVTFRNESNTELQVSGDGWGNVLPLASGEAFTQGFDFKGKYTYSAKSSPQITGEIIVE